MIVIVGMLGLPLALWTAFLFWRYRRKIARLEWEIEMLKHPERFPPLHPMCRSVMAKDQ